MHNSNVIDLGIEKITTVFKVRKYQIIIGMLIVLAIIAVGAITLLNSPKPVTPAAAPADLTASVKEIQGNVTVEQPGQTVFSQATLSTVLQAHGELQTGSSSTARLDLPSGTIIRVAPSSIFTLESNKNTPSGLTTTLNLTLGQIFIILKGGSLNITIPSGVASVRGSYMSALIYPNSSEIFIECLEGHCSADNNTGNLDLTNGQKAILFYEGNQMTQAPKLTPMSHADYQSWLAISPESAPIINQPVNDTKSDHHP